MSRNNDFEEIKKELIEIKQLIKAFKNDLKGLVEIQQRLIHERLGVPAPAPPKEYGEDVENKTKINISKQGDYIKVSGQTFPFKDTIKSAGPAKFNDKSWILPINCIAKLKKKLEEIGLKQDVDFSVDSNLGSESESQPEQEESEEGFGSGF